MLQEVEHAEPPGIQALPQLRLDLCSLSGTGDLAHRVVADGFEPKTGEAGPESTLLPDVGPARAELGVDIQQKRVAGETEERNGRKILAEVAGGGLAVNVGRSDCGIPVTPYLKGAELIAGAKDEVWG